MAEDPNPPEPRNVQQDLPAKPDAETREETIARVVDAEESVGADRGGSPDPSTRRGVQRIVWRVAGMAALAGLVVGAIAGLVLSISPGPFETSGAGETFGYMALLGGALALAALVLSVLIALAREDGRVEREVEQTTGRGPEGPGDPSSPERDLTPR